MPLTRGEAGRRTPWGGLPEGRRLGSPGDARGSSPLPGKLTLEQLQPLMSEMCQWAVESHPKEACGLIVERNGALEAMRCENLQDALNRRDPGRYPRTARTAYHLDGLALMRAEESGGVVRGVFHSHPDRGAYFSDEDVLGALGGDPDGTPVLPGVDYLVLAARAAGVDDARLYSWAPEARTFREKGTR